MHKKFKNRLLIGLKKWKKKLKSASEKCQNIFMQIPWLENQYLFNSNYYYKSFTHFYQMWYGERAQPRQQLALDVVWVVPGEIRKYYLQVCCHI